MEEIIKGFVDETVKNLAETIEFCSVGDRLLEKSEVEKVFFVMHSLTGSAAMFGFNNVAQYSLYTERVYDKIRKGEKHITPEIKNMTVTVSQKIKKIVLKEDVKGEQPELIDFFKTQLES